MLLCGSGSLRAPQKAATVHLKTSSESNKTIDSSPDDSAAQSSVVESQTLSSPSNSRSSSSSRESDEMLVMKPQPPPALFPSMLPNTAKCPHPKVPPFLLDEGKMSEEEEIAATESIVSSSSGTSSDKNVKPLLEASCCNVAVGSDISSEPLTFHTDFGDCCNTIASSDEERKDLETSVASDSPSKLLDVNALSLIHI